jgi:hypothetical protein
MILADLLRSNTAKAVVVKDVRRVSCNYISQPGMGRVQTRRWTSMQAGVVWLMVLKSLISHWTWTISFRTETVEESHLVTTRAVFMPFSLAASRIEPTKRPSGRVPTMPFSVLKLVARLLLE